MSIGHYNWGQGSARNFFDARAKYLQDHKRWEQACKDISESIGPKVYPEEPKWPGKY